MFANLMTKCSHCNTTFNSNSNILLFPLYYSRHSFHSSLMWHTKSAHITTRADINRRFLRQLILSILKMAFWDWISNGRRHCICCCRQHLTVIKIQFAAVIVAYWQLFDMFIIRPYLSSKIKCFHSFCTSC